VEAGEGMVPFLKISLGVVMATLAWAAFATSAGAAIVVPQQSQVVTPEAPAPAPAPSPTSSSPPEQSYEPSDGSGSSSLSSGSGSSSDSSTHQGSRFPGNTVAPSRRDPAFPSWLPGPNDPKCGNSCKDIWVGWFEARRNTVWTDAIAHDDDELREDANALGTMAERISKGIQPSSETESDTARDISNQQLTSEDRPDESSTGAWADLGHSDEAVFAIGMQALVPGGVSSEVNPCESGNGIALSCKGGGGPGGENGDEGFPDSGGGGGSGSDGSSDSGSDAGSDSSSDAGSDDSGSDAGSDSSSDAGSDDSGSDDSGWDGGYDLGGGSGSNSGNGSSEPSSTDTPNTQPGEVIEINDDKPAPDGRTRTVTYWQPGEIIVVQAPAPPRDQTTPCRPGNNRLRPIRCPDGSVGIDCPFDPRYDPILIPVPQNTDRLVSACPLNAPLGKLAVCVRERNKYSQWPVKKVNHLIQVCGQYEAELSDLKRGTDWTIPYAERQRRIKFLEGKFDMGGSCELFADSLM
jgi:hypothetical protein